MSIPALVYHKLPKRLPRSLGFDKFSVQLDGTEDWIEIPHDPSLSPPAITVALYIYLLEHPITGSGYDKGFYCRLLARDVSNTRISARIQTTAVSWADGAYTGNATLPLNRWVHVGLTYDDPVLTLYYNGEIDSTFNVGGTLNDTGNRVIVLGAESTATYPPPMAYLRAAYANLVVYNRALSPSEMRRIALDYHDPIRDGLVLWLDMEEGSGLTLNDKSGLGNHGSLNPAATPPVWRRNKKWELRSQGGL